MSDDFEDEIIARAMKLHALGAPVETSVREDDDFVGDMDELDHAEHIIGRLGGTAGNMGMAEKTSLRDQKWQDLAGVAPWTRINPPSALRGTLGGQQTVQAGQKLIVANWAADEDAEALPVTVTVAPVEQVNPAGAHAGQNFSPYAIVQFGTRGFSVLVEVDIGKGCQFTVGASAVSVQVALPTDAASPANITTMKLAGMLSFYPVVRTTNVTRTVRTSTFDSSTVYLIPAFAKTLTFIRFEQGTTVTIDFLDANGVALPGEYVLVGAISQSEVIYLPDDAISINVTATGATHGRAVFGLAL